MLTSKVASFSDLFWTGWLAWKQMFHAMPYWDPYGATLTLALVVAALGYKIKSVLD